METLDFVSLGRPACIFRWKGSGRICECSENEANSDYCVSQCPIAAEPTTDCTALYRDMAGHWDDNDGGAEFILVDDTLKVFKSENPVQGGVDCSVLDELEDLVSSGAGKEAIQEQWSTIRADQNGWWIQPAFLGQLASGLEVREDLLYHYDIQSGGRTLWSTKVTDASGCPKLIPWNDSTELIDCFQKKTGTTGDWLLNELSYVNGNGPAWTRRNWATSVLKRIVLLKFLTFEISGIHLSGKKENGVPDTYEFRGGTYQDLLTRVGTKRQGEHQETQAEKCQSPPCECIDVDAMDIETAMAEFSDYPAIVPCNNSLEESRVRWVAERTWSPSEVYGNASIYGDLIISFWEDGEDGVPQFLSIAAWEDQTGVPGSLQEKFALLMPNFVPKAQPNLPEESFDTAMNPEVFLDALRLACYLTQSGSWGCGTDPCSLPSVASFDDLFKLQKHIRCAANDIHRKSEMLIFAGLPEILKEGFQSEGFEGYYPGYEGENLRLLLGIESDLRRFKTNADGIKDTLFQLAQVVEQLHNQKEQLDIQSQIKDLQLLKNVIQRAIQVAQASAQPGPSGWIAGGAAAAGAAAGNAIDLQIDELEQRAVLLQQENLLSEALSTAAGSLADLRSLLNDVASTYESIQNNLAGLRRNQTKAAEAWATMQMLDSDAAGHVLPVNTVMRRRQNTLRVRYQKALDRAKKLAYIARRAIEFRFGVDMDEMTEPMTLVPPPSEWAGRICSLQGFDYQKIRDASPLDPLFDPDNEGSDVGDNYAHMYVGDYVENLSDFVESYAIDYPFSDEGDIAVISVRDDIKRTRTKCQVPSINLLYMSDDVGKYVPVEEGSEDFVGWRTGGCDTDEDPICVETQPGGSEAASTCGLDFCFGQRPESFEGSSVAVRVRDRLNEAHWVGDATYYTRPFEFENSGYYVQDVGIVEAGEYILSWYDHLPFGEDGVSVPSVPYKIEVLGSGDGIVIAPFDGWERHILRFTLAEQKEIEIAIHPSEADCQGPDCEGLFGDVWLWGMQLERADPWRCQFYDGDCSQVPPLPYEATDRRRMTTKDDCPDYDGAVLRSEAFERNCVCPGPDNLNGECDEDDASSQYKICYRSTTISLPLESIESGEIIPSNNIAIGNFNYRQDEVAVNLVGTNIRTCEGSDSPSMCNSNAFIPYTLVHQGTVPVRNYHGKTYEFDMPVARVEHGKALTAEVLVTNPPTSTHTQLLGAYFKTGLRGRPLQGNYELRIWETPELNWEAVEDVQLIFKYRYWTRMSYGN
jgi:hypothetical protein